MLRIAKGEGSAAAVERTEAPSAVRTVLGKSEKKPQLNTPRYEYNDVYTHGETRSTQMDPSEWRCVCVDDMEGYNSMMCRDLSNVMHRDSAVEGGATRHEKGGS